MGIIKETIEHPTISNVEIDVDEHAKDESREPYDIISLNITFAEINNPDQLIELGKWLIEQGTRIKNEYTSTGKVRKSALKSDENTLKCECEMPSKMHGKNICWRCKRHLT